MVLKRTVDHPNMWAFGCQLNVNGERAAVSRAAGKLFQTAPATVKLLIPSVILVLGIDSNPVPADRRCRLPAMAEIARQSYAKYIGTNPLEAVMVTLRCATEHTVVVINVILTATD